MSFNVFKRNLGTTSLNAKKCVVKPAVKVGCLE